MMANYKVDTVNKYQRVNPQFKNLWTNSRTAYFIKQKLCGVVMFIIGIVCPILFDGDVTFSLFAIPTGIGLLVTKQQIMTF